MGDEPNPVVQHQNQDATRRHRTFSAVSSSADYIFTLLRIQARGRRVVTVMNLPNRHELPPWPWPQSLRGQSRVRDDFPRYCPPQNCGQGFTVISRFLYGISPVSPQIKVPIRPADFPSRTL